MVGESCVVRANTDSQLQSTHSDMGNIIHIHEQGPIPRVPLRNCINLPSSMQCLCDELAVSQKLSMLYMCLRIEPCIHLHVHVHVCNATMYMHLPTVSKPI